MDDDALLAALRVEADRVAAISGDDVDIEQPVAACPGWGVGRLVGHLGRVHRWATAMLQADPPVFIAPTDIDSTAPRDPTVFAWYADGLPPLFAELERLDLDRPVFTWAGERDRRWWLRRLTHETAVHRFDAEQALTAPSPIDPAVAADGIDELFEVFVPARFDAETFAKDDADGQTMHLHCTDVDGEWLVRFGADAVHVERRHAKGDVAIRGAASDLCLVLWNRIDPERCEVFGDRELFDRFLDAATF